MEVLKQSAEAAANAEADRGAYEFPAPPAMTFAANPEAAEFGALERSWEAQRGKAAFDTAVATASATAAHAKIRTFTKLSEETTRLVEQLRALRDAATSHALPYDVVTLPVRNINARIELLARAPAIAGTIADFSKRAAGLQDVIARAEATVTRVMALEDPELAQLTELYAAKDELKKKVVALAMLHQERLVAVRLALDTDARIVPLSTETRADGATVSNFKTTLDSWQEKLDKAVKVREW